MTTYADCNTAENDMTVNTGADVATITIPSGQGGSIKFIRVAGGQVGTTAQDFSAYIQLTRGSLGGTFRFPIFAGSTDGDLGCFGLPAESIPVDIPVLANEVITLHVVPNCTLTGVHAGIVWEA